MHKRTKALAICPAVKAAVAARDSIDGHPCCIICGSPEGQPNAHYIARAQGGLGIEENVVTLCPKCHRLYDQSDRRGLYGEMIRDYLRVQYDHWDEARLTYKKWEDEPCTIV